MQEISTSTQGSNPRAVAFEIGERVLPIYEEVFPGDLRPRLLLPVVIDMTTGLADEALMATARRQLQASIDDAAVAAVSEGPAGAMRIHAGVMALKAISLCLEEDIDLAEIERAANVAAQHAPCQSSATH